MVKAGPKGQITAPPLDVADLGEGGARVAAFLEKYVICPKGTGAGEAFRVRPWQAEILAGLFDAPRPRGGLVSLPRGNGKTTLAAAIGLYGLFADGEPSPQVLVVASDERQAGICREIARRMVELSPELAERCHILKDRLRVPHNDGVFMSLPAEPAALHGWDPSLLVVDELHVVTEETWEAVTSVPGKRERSLTLAISTPAASRDSVMWRIVESHRADPDPMFYVREYAAPVSCEIDDETAWHEANPALGDFLYVDGMRAVLGKMRPESFRRLRLGQWVDDAGAWIAHSDWANAADESVFPVGDGEQVVLGFDGSVGDDSTALVAVTVAEPHRLFVVGVWERPTGPDGAHWRVPRDDVNLAVEMAFDRWDVAELACDPYYWQAEIDAWSDRWNTSRETRVLEFPTGSWRRMAPATESFYTAVADGSLVHDGDPRLAAHVTAAVVRSTPAGSILSKDRRHSPRKIDLAVASVIALQRATWHLANPTGARKGKQPGRVVTWGRR